MQLANVVGPIPPALSSLFPGVKPTLELFPGSENWSHAHQDVGFVTERHNWQGGKAPQYNMCCPKYFANFRTNLRGGKFSVVHIATECATFSTAPGDLYRTMDDPLGKHHGLVNDRPHVRLKTQQATLYGENSLVAFEDADSGGSIVTLEQPLGTRLLALPKASRIQQRLNDGTLFLFKTSYCRFGKPFRGTRIILTNTKEYASLQRPCRCKAKHKTILAFHATKTTAANSYPRPLCRLWAKVSHDIVVSKRNMKHG